MLIFIYAVSYTNGTRRIIDDNLKVSEFTGYRGLPLEDLNVYLIYFVSILLQ